MALLDSGRLRMCGLWISDDLPTATVTYQRLEGNYDEYFC